MKKLKLMTAILAMTALLVCTVALFSPYAPVVEPAADIEVIWAIEDAREESDTPLVTCLENNGMRLGYDAQENTFYCPIGLDNGEAWPELRLSAPGTKGVRLMFADDYGYDWCEDAVREGVAYQILTYTETEFAYAQIVFTGLPVVTLSTQAEISEADVTGEVAFASPEGGFTVHARTHLRGGASRKQMKGSYKVEFTRGAGGGAALVQVPGIGQTGEVILLACTADPTMMRDRLSWAVWSALADESDPYGARKTRYVELFINDRYAGCYVLMKPYDEVEELRKFGADAPATDSVYRSGHIGSAGERLYIQNKRYIAYLYEVYYEPVAGHEFEAFKTYELLEQLWLQDPAMFEALLLKHVNMESLLRFYLLIQGGGLADNVANNMYIIAHQENSRLVYYFAPWDMDLGWGHVIDEETGDYYHGLMEFRIAEGMLLYDTGEKPRKMLTQMWANYRERIFNETAIQWLVDQYTHELNDSGAYGRETLRWRGDIQTADGQELVRFARDHYEALDELFAKYAEPGMQ